MRYRFACLAAAALAAACSSATDSSATVAGSYQTFFATTLSAPSIGGSATLQELTGIITLGAPASDGSFGGSFAMTGAGGSGTVAGVMSPGGAVTISHFGDPSAAPLQAVTFLETALPDCDFGQAVSSAMGGAVENGNLAFTGGLTMPCSWTSGDSTVVVPTVVTVQVSGSAN